MVASADTFRVNTDQAGGLRLAEQLAVLRLPAAKQRRLVKAMASEVRSTARQNIRLQQTVDGSPMEKRANSRNKRKLLRKMGRKMVVFNQGNEAAVVTWKNPLAGRVAYKHQMGIPETMTASKMQRMHGKPDYNAPATRDMARALLTEGYRHPVKTRKGRTRLKRVSLKWITENMSIGQAGLILKELRGTTKKQQWTIRTPARPFLGASDNDSDRMLNSLAVNALAGLKAKGAI